MALVANSQLTASSTPTAAFAITVLQFVVDVDAGRVRLETRRSSADGVWKPVAGTNGETNGQMLLVGPSSTMVINTVSGREYRLVPDGQATAQVEV